MLIQINYIIPDSLDIRGLQTKDLSFHLASGISKNRYVVYTILQTLMNTMEILMTLAFHQFTSKQTMNWPFKGRYQAEPDHFHVYDLQSRPYSGLCSDTHKQSDAPFHSDAPSTLPNHFIRAFQDLQALFVCLCVRIMVEMHVHP